MLYAGALGLALAMGLLAVPVQIAFRLRRLDRLEGSATFIWLFGVVRVPVPLDEKQKDGSAKDPSAEKPGAGQEAKPERAGWSFQKPLIIIRSGPFRRRVVKLIWDLAGSIKATGVEFHAVAGLDDPADTGMLFGAIYPALAALNPPHSSAVSIQPDFAGEIFQFTGSGTIRLVPLQVLFIAVFFILSPAALKMIWILRPWKR